MKQTPTIILLFLIAAMAFGGCNMQNKFLYFPSSEVPSERMLTSVNMKLWQAIDGDYRGLISKKNAATPNGTIDLLRKLLGRGFPSPIAKETSVPIAVIILITPWDSLASVAKSLFPFLPVKMLLTDKYGSNQNLKSFTKNISVVGAERDEILPIKHAHNLYKNLPEGRKKMWVIKGAGHNDWPFYADASLFKEITDFVKSGK